MGELNDPTGEKELIADQLRRGVSASEVMAGVRARAAEVRPPVPAELDPIGGEAGPAGTPAPDRPTETERLRQLEVREVPYETVAPWRAQAARDHVALGPTGRTTWFAAYLDATMVGVAGLIRVGKLARVKGVYVPRALRGEGIGTKLTEAVIAAAPADCDVEVLAYNPAFYRGHGFDLLGEFRPGVSRLIFARKRS